MRSHRKHRTHRLLLAAAAGSVLINATSANAANKTWAAPASGDWTTAAAWNLAGVPVNGDAVLITQNSASNYLVNYDNPSTTQVFPVLTLNNTGGGAAQMRTAGGTVYNITNATVGNTGQGQWQIGTATANLGTLSIGSVSGSTGTVTLSTGDLDTTNRFSIGRSGTGIFTQSGGTVTASSFVSIGDDPSGVGTYTLNGGALNAGTTLLVGNQGDGTFNVLGGSISFGSPLASMSVGGNSGATGRFNLTSGIVNVPDRTQIGGSVGASGTATIGGGTFNTGTLQVGASGNGTFTQTGGRVDVANQVILAVNAGATGLYELNGGTLSAGSIVINSGGAFNHSSGTISTSTITLNTGGTYGRTGGLFRDGFVQNGGTVITNFFNNGGTFTYNGGSFPNRLDNLGTVIFIADMVLGDGMLQRDSGNPLTIPAARTITMNGQGLDLANQTLFLFGALNTTTTAIGGFVGTSTPAFAHQSGTHTVSNELRIGDGASAGTYNLNAGTLNMAAASVGASVGVNQPGQLNIVNGRATISHLRVGNGAAGTVNHSGAGDLSAPLLTIGALSAGTYLQSSSGASVNVTSGLTIGASGRYNMSAGTLFAGQTANNGSFTQTGGTANLNQVIGVGRMDITNTASLTVDRIRNDFLFVADTARVFTTANGGAIGLSRLNTLFFEDFENLNFFGKWDLNNNDLVIDTDIAAQADEYDRTRRYIQSGFASGGWNGNGLNSSAAIAAAATPNRTGLGYARSADVLAFSGGTATFVGQTVDDTTVLVRYTVLGDQNLDGTAGIGDFAVLASNFNTPGDWVDGDFNYDGSVNIGDFSLLASNFNKTLAGALPRAATVPEPAAAVLATATGLLLTRRRRR